MFRCTTDLKVFQLHEHRLQRQKPRHLRHNGGLFT